MTHPRLAEAVLGWDTLNWQRALEFWDQHLPRRLTDWTALELGAAGGGLSLYLALKGARAIYSNLRLPDAQVCQLHQDYGVKMLYDTVDARALPYADQSLDLVCCKSVLGGIRKNAQEDPKPLIINEIRRVLKPGGWFLAAENLQGHPLHGWLRQRYVPWSGGWEYLPANDWLALLKDFTDCHQTSFGLTGLLGRTVAQRRQLAQLDRCLDAYMPSHWHYVLALVARKPETEGVES
ncbi:MAG: class I SAM-dependent methyltransferase [Candidatus Sericytochromatia bacterium]|nr:class I SAM-dependent methyltransferase [Candidatus Sericytochromatia bacterium]